MNEMPPDSIQMANPGCQTTLGWDPEPRTPAATAQLHAPHRETWRDRRRPADPKKLCRSFQRLICKQVPGRWAGMTLMLRSGVEGLDAHQGGQVGASKSHGGKEESLMWSLPLF